MCAVLVCHMDGSLCCSFLTCCFFKRWHGARRVLWKVSATILQSGSHPGAFSGWNLLSSGLSILRDRTCTHWWQNIKEPLWSVRASSSCPWSTLKCEPQSSAKRTPKKWVVSASGVRCGHSEQIVTGACLSGCPLFIFFFFVSPCI